MGTQGKSPHLSVPLFPQCDVRAHLRSKVISVFVLCSSFIKMFLVIDKKQRAGVKFVTLTS